MSHQPHDTHATHASGNEDDVNIRKIVAVGAVSLAIFALSALAAFVILRYDTNRLAGLGAAVHAAPGVGKDEIGIVDQVHFDTDERLTVWRAARKQRLESYGWVDRAKGTIHIPIEEAMKEVVTSAQAAGGQAP